MCFYQATQVLFISTQNFVTVSSLLGGCGLKTLSLPGKYARWVIIKHCQCLIWEFRGPGTEPSDGSGHVIRGGRGNEALINSGHQLLKLGFVHGEAMRF